jgi:transcriptional regulator with XRE-family HTH domain
MKTLGEFIREKRNEMDISLRELARQLGITPPFLSDIELGRRYPSDPVLARFAEFFKIPVAELKQLDHRESVAQLKHYIATRPELGAVFRTMMDKVKRGEISIDDLMKKWSSEGGPG